MTTVTAQPAFTDLDAATEATARAHGPTARLAAAEREAALYDQFPAEPYGHAGLLTHEAVAEPWPEPEAGS